MFVIADCLQGVAKGILTASGLQKYGALLTFIAYFILGMPLSYYLSFGLGWEIEGLWYGPTVACFFNFLVYWYIFLRTDWAKHIELQKILRQKDKSAPKATSEVKEEEKDFLKQK
jgi:MATE family multidrug resistance protein